MKPYRPGRPKKIKDPMNERTPHSPGEYRITYEDGQQYIGQTCDLNRRQYQHVRSGKIREGSTFEYKEADRRFSSRSLAEHERQKIRQHNPSLNRSRGGEGRPSKKRR